MQPIDAALDAALIVMQYGGSTAMADRTLTNILSGCKQEGASAVWRLDFIAVTNTADGQSSRILRPVGAIGTNLVRAG